MNCLQNLREYKVGPFTVFDTVVSFVVAYYFAQYFKYDVRAVMLLVLPVSVLIHKMVGQSTPLTQMAFSKRGDYWVKALLVILTVAGVNELYKAKNTVVWAPTI